MSSVTQIRKDLEGCIGKQVVLKADQGRKRIVTKQGILEETHPNLFIVRVSNAFDDERRVSYTYSDILTSTVEITIFE